MEPTGWLDTLRLPTKTLTALCLVCGLLLFSPVEIVKQLGLSGVVSEYRPSIGIGFLVTLALVIVNGSAAAWHFVYPWIAQAYWIRIGKRRLNNLTPEEKEILSIYIEGQTRSQTLSVQSGTVSALQREHIILRGSPLGTLYGFDYIIQPWAWEYLNEHPELLK